MVIVSMFPSHCTIYKNRILFSINNRYRMETSILKLQRSQPNTYQIIKIISLAITSSH